MWVKSVVPRFFPFCVVCIFTFGTIASHSASLCAQSTSNRRNGSERNDEKREDKRVSDAKREVGRTRMELEKLQTDWEKSIEHSLLLEVTSSNSNRVKNK